MIKDILIKLGIIFLLNSASFPLVLADNTAITHIRVHNDTEFLQALRNNRVIVLPERISINLSKTLANAE